MSETEHPGDPLAPLRDLDGPAADPRFADRLEAELRVAHSRDRNVGGGPVAAGRRARSRAGDARRDRHHDCPAARRHAVGGARADRRPWCGRDPARRHPPWSTRPTGSRSSTGRPSSSPPTVRRPSTTSPSGPGPPCRSVTAPSSPTSSARQRRRPRSEVAHRATSRRPRAPPRQAPILPGRRHRHPPASTTTTAAPTSSRPGRSDDGPVDVGPDTPTDPPPEDVPPPDDSFVRPADPAPTDGVDLALRLRVVARDRNVVITWRTDGAGGHPWRTVVLRRVGDGTPDWPAADGTAVLAETEGSRPGS